MDSKDNARVQDIRWETVKTEEEEYLDKLREPIHLMCSSLALPIHMAPP